MEEPQESFGDQLRRLRESAGFSQESLAERAGLSANAISALERGERKRPYPDTVRRLAEALGLSDGQRESLSAAARPHRPDPAVVTGVETQHLLPHVPVEPDALIGRDREIEVTHRLLLRRETRLLTLTGPGGIGKTRLAMRLVQDVRDEFADGVVWVDLAPLSDASLVLPAISNALAIRSTPGDMSPTSIASAIGQRVTLLVLDNAEHVRDAAPDLATILHSCPGLRALVTSRAPLSIRGEQECVVPPLALPLDDSAADISSIIASPSVQVLLRSIRLRQPSFEVNAENARAVSEICHSLDGVPLALELAAARVPLLGVHQLLERLEASLSLLTGGKRDTPSRHQTMESTIRWSYDLLAPPDQKLFRLLSVFSGGWTLEAVESVLAEAGADGVDVIDGMATLIEQSLVRSVHSHQGRLRYTMLGTFREFGRRRLRESGEEPAALDAHLTWIRSIASTAEPHLIGPAQDFWLDQLASELDNVRAALGSGMPGGERDRLRLAASFWRFWYMRGFFAEGRTWLERCLSSPGGAKEDIVAKALNGAGILAQESGDFAGAESFCTRALALRRASGDKHGVAYTLSNLGLLADHRGDYERAISLYEESLALSREVDHQPGIANALNNLGLVHRDIGDVASARDVHEESLALLRRIGDQRGTANALNNLGNIAGDMGDIPRAASLHRESLEIRRRLDDRPGIAMSLKNLGTIARLEGNLEDAVRYYRESLRIRKERSDVLGAILTIGDVAGFAADTGYDSVAVRLVAAVRGIRERLGAPAPPAIQSKHEGIMRHASSVLPATAFAEAARRGESLDGDRVIDEAISFLDQLS